MRNNLLVLKSLVFSVLVHAVLVLWALFFRLPGIHAQVKKTPYFFNVRILRESAVSPSPTKSIILPRVESFQFSDFTQESVLEKMSRQELAAMQSSGLNFSEKNPLEETVIYSNRNYASEISQDVPETGVLKQKIRRPTEQQLTDSGRLVGEDALDLPVDPSDNLVESGFIDRMPGVTPDYIGQVATDDAGSGAGSGGDSWADYQPVIQQKNRYASIGDIMLWNLRVYKPDDESYTYYKISLRVNPQLSLEKLPSIPKEIIFLVDNSWSMEQKRIEEFKNGLRHVLSRLNEGDRFNIMVFKETLALFAPQSIFYEESSLENALRFVDGLTMGGKTDTYQALYQTLSAGEVMSPSYVILFSDGRPTQGVTDSTRLISEISRFNDGRTAIFSFSGGLRTNRYLLDFIAYRNRGWAEYSQRTHRIGEDLGLLYDKIRHPVLLNLRYQVSGVDKDQLYPKVMPDIFRNTEMVFYGRTEVRGDFILRLLGQVNGQTVEFLLNGDLQNASAEGTEIASQWALNRVYDLISQLEVGQDKESVRLELEKISRKFRIHVPYLEDLR